MNCFSAKGGRNGFGYAVNRPNRSVGAGGKTDQDRSDCCLKESQVAEHF